MPRRVVIVAFEPVQALDVAGPAEVLSTAASVAGGEDPAYAVEVVSPDGVAGADGAGFALAPAGPLEDVRGAIDTLIVAGGAGARHAAAAEIESVRVLSGRSRPGASGG